MKHNQSDRTKGLADPLLRLRVLQAIERGWSDVLPTDAVRLLQRIADVTTGWNRDTFSCSLGSLISGKNAAGEKLHGGQVGCSLATAERMLKVLRDRGLVSTTRRPTGLTFTIHHAYIREPWSELGVPPPPPVPKKMEGLSTPSRGGLCSITLRDQNPPGEGHRIAGLQSQLDNNLSSTGVGSASTRRGSDTFSNETSDNNSPDPETAVSRANKGIGESRPEKSNCQTVSNIDAQPGTGPKTDLEKAVELLREAAPVSAKGGQAAGRLISAARVVWEAAWAAQYIHARVAPPWSQADRGKMLQVFDRWSRRNGHFDEYLTWVVDSWVDIISRSFGWMRQPKPEHPNVGFVLAFVDKFEDAYVGRRRRHALSTNNLTQMEELRLKGFSEEAALNEIVSRRVTGEMRRREASRPKVSYKGRPPPMTKEARRQVHSAATGERLPDTRVSRTSGRFISAKGVEAAEAILFGPAID